MHEYSLANTVLSIAEKHKCSIATESNIEKIGSALFNTFGEAGLHFYKRVWNLYMPFQSGAEVETRYRQISMARNRISFASFMYYASMVGIKRMEFLITYNGDHMAIS